MSHRALLESRRLARLACEVAQVGHWRLDVATSQITWSDEIFRMFGIEPGDEPALEAAMSMVHDEDRWRAHKALEQAVVDGQGFTKGVRLIRPNGEVRHVETRATCEVDSEERVVGVFGVMIDVTAQVRAREAIEESETKYRILADNIADVVIRVDMNDVIHYVSPSCSRYGYEPADLVGRSGYEIVHRDDIGLLRTLIADLFSGAPVDPAANRCYRVRAKDGSWVWMEGSPAIVRDAAGRPVEVISLLRDVSLRVALEGQLREARDEARAAAVAKTEFLANMSHEIRTPLTSILGFARLLSEDATLPEAARRYVSRINVASATLLSTVNDVLDFSKLEAGQTRLELRPTCVRSLCRDLISLFEVQASAKGLDLACQCDDAIPGLVLVDPVRLRQILFNLMGNALKFTERGHVLLQVTSEAEGRLTLSVADTGPGISLEDRERLFGRFQQLDGTSARGHGGTGLGLAICKGLAEAMGGRIDVESRLGAGACFIVEIEAPAAAAAASAIERQPEASSVAGVRVLIVDDNPANRELVRVTLNSLGARTIEAPDGQTAVTLAGLQPLDVILMDINMPGMDGVEALRLIRAGHGPSAGAPAYAFTANVLPDRVADLLQRGFDGHLCKPIEVGALLAAVAGAAASGGRDDAFVQAAMG